MDAMTPGRCAAIPAAANNDFDTTFLCSGSKILLLLQEFDEADRAFIS